MIKIIYCFITVIVFTHFLSAHYDSHETVYKKKLMPYALSNKGDLSTNTDSIKRRLFKMPGDGNCFLWSAGGGMNRKKAVDIWLKYASNSTIRAMGSNEIFNSFFCDELPLAMKVKNDYNEFKALLIDVESRLNDETTIIGQMEALGAPYSTATRLAIENEQEELLRRIRREYCTKESVYRDFVNLALSQDSYYLFTTCDSLSDHPLFIDILAFDQNKNLVTYAYGTSNDLVQTHRYVRPGGANGTWEMVLQGQHYNRVVPINDINRLNESELDELACLASLILFSEDIIPPKLTVEPRKLVNQRTNAANNNSKNNKEKSEKNRKSIKKKNKEKQKPKVIERVSESVQQAVPVRVEYVFQKPRSRTSLRKIHAVNSQKRNAQQKRIPVKTTKNNTTTIKIFHEYNPQLKRIIKNTSKHLIVPIKKKSKTLQFKIRKSGIKGKGLPISSAYKKYKRHKLRTIQGLVRKK